MDKELNLIKKAEEVLKRPYAGIQSIANAWEFLLNREQAQSAERYFRADGYRAFIEGLNLPMCYENGAPAIRTAGLSTAEVLNRHSLCVSVRSVQEKAALANHPWPMLTPNPMVAEPMNETDEWSEAELLGLFHKSNKKGSKGPIKKSQRDLAEEFGISQGRIGQLLKKAESLLELQNPKPINSVFGYNSSKIKDGKRT